MMILKEECKKVGYSVTDFAILVDVPVQTLRDWCKSREVLMEVIFSGIACGLVLDRMDELRSEFDAELAVGRENSTRLFDSEEQPTAGESEAQPDTTNND